MQDYGYGDVTYQAVGGFAGLVKLVDDFYEVMEMLPEAKKIRAMHEDDLSLARDKLVSFLSGWMGGPPLFAEKYGSVHLPQAHQHLRIAEADRDAWLSCMREALARQHYPQALQAHLLAQLFVPAERIRLVSQANHQG